MNIIERENDSPGTGVTGLEETKFVKIAENMNIETIILFQKMVYTCDMYDDIFENCKPCLERLLFYTLAYLFFSLEYIVSTYYQGTK